MEPLYSGHPWGKKILAVINYIGVAFIVFMFPGSCSECELSMNFKSLQSNCICVCIEELFCTQIVNLGLGFLAVITEVAFIYAWVAVKRGSTVACSLSKQPLPSPPSTSGNSIDHAV